jgi:hypothetical protein
MEQKITSRDPAYFADYMARNPIKRRAWALMRQAHTRRRKKGIRVTITAAWVEERLLRGVCEVTGIPFGPPRSAFGPSLDRKQAGGDYTPENTQVVCMLHNMVRNQWGDEPMKKYLAAMSTKAI